MSNSIRNTSFTALNTNQFARSMRTLCTKTRVQYSGERYRYSMQNAQISGARFNKLVAEKTKVLKAKQDSLGQDQFTPKEIEKFVRQDLTQDASRLGWYDVLGGCCYAVAVLSGCCTAYPAVGIVLGALVAIDFLRYATDLPPVMPALVGFLISIPFTVALDTVRKVANGVAGSVAGIVAGPSDSRKEGGMQIEMTNIMGNISKEGR